ncbi:TetR family transcriptional regulator [Rhodococcus erythropolis]
MRAIRFASGMSLRELARRLKVSPATVTALEKGYTTMTVDRLHEIATAIGVSPSELFAAGPPSLVPTDVPNVDAMNWKQFTDPGMDVILRAALTCIFRKGYQGCSIRDIAEEAQSSVSAMYRYYPSKQAILVALIDLTMTDLLRRAKAARDDGAPGNPVQRFSQLVESLALYHSCRKELGFVGNSEMRSLETAHLPALVSKQVSLQRMVDTEVREGVDLGLFTTNRPREASRAVVNMCVAIAQWYDLTSGEPPEQIAADYVRFALDLVGYRP